MASARKMVDYGGAPEEDRFFAVDEGTKERARRKMSASLRKNKITGGTGETWVIRDVDGDLMALDYDSGKKEGEVWRGGGGLCLGGWGMWW
jgi:hypothetical protein